MADFSGFMTALGQGFTGYGKDQALRDESEARDQAAQQRAVMQKAQLDKLTREAQVSQVIQANWPKAVAGDQQAIGAIAAVHPQLAATLTKEPPRPQYDSERGVMVNADGTFTPIKGLPQKPQKDVKDHFTFVTGTDADGKPIIYRGNTATGEMGATGVGKPGAAGGALAQTQQARMLAAVSEARLADERMRAFEEKLLGGQAEVSPLQQAAGSLMTNLAGSHSFLGALGQAGSEYALSKNSPEYQQYLRDAMTIGRAEQMISPRGGNETMVRANSLLARAGTGAAKGTIEASRMARQALFGKSGGIAQALTPQQTQTLDAGVQQIKSGELGGAPSQSHGAVPSFEDWKKSRGIP